MTKFVVTLGAVIGVFAAFAQQNKTTFRDSMGRNRGSATTDRYGKTTYRDAMGRVTGTSTKDSSGRVTYRDAMGRVVGSQR